MPRFEAFKSAAHFYGVTFHELGHWTGHRSRLDRDLRSRFGERAYAAEELVAELCAAFLCAEFSIDGDLRHTVRTAAAMGSASITPSTTSSTLAADWPGFAMRAVSLLQGPASNPRMN
jgi:antirestriction protein ArdC